MNLIILAALIAAGGSAKLDRSYLPPASAATAGGSAGNLQLPFSRSNQVSQGVPVGGFVNDDEGVVVDAALAVPGVRASNQQSGLGGPRNSYGSTASKVGEAAFKGTAQNQQFLNQYGEPDLSAFHKPMVGSSSSSGHSQIIRDPSQTLNYQNDIDIDKFNYGFETNNGIKVAQNGIDMNGIQSQGVFSYVGDDGKQYSVTYTADKNGYRPQGSHLPTSPPIPREILLALERNAKDEAAGIFDNGSYDARKYNAAGDYTKNVANGKYNDRQSHEFGNRPVFANGFINQNQQAFGIPNYNGQFGYNTGSKGSTFSKPDSCGFGSSFMQSGSRFGLSNDPTKTNNNMEAKDNQSPVSSINMMGLNNSPKPLWQQNLQEQNFQKPSFVRPSSYDVSNDGLSISPQSNFLASSSPLNQGSANSFGNGDRISSSFSQTYDNKPSQASFDLDSLTNQQILNKQQSFNNKKPYYQNDLSSSFMSSEPSTGNFGSQAIQQFPSSYQSDHSSESPGSSSFSSSSQNLEHSQNSNGFSSNFPTKQPLTTLTTPLESFETTNATEIVRKTENFKIEDSDTTKIPEISSTNKEIQAFPNQLTTIGDFSGSYTGTYTPSVDSQTDKHSSQNFGSQTTQVLENNQQMAQASHSLKQPHGVDFTSNTQRPSYDGSQFVQPQAPDHSYLYNPPSKPFNTPSTMPGFNFPRAPSSPINKVTPSLRPQTSSFTNTPQTAIFSTFNQGIGVTQAAISPFPSTIPIASSELKQPTQIASLNTPSSSAFSQVSPTIASAIAQISTFPDDQKLTNIQVVQDSQTQDKSPSTPIQKYTGEIYQYSKPTEALPTDSQKQNELTHKQQEQSGFSTLQLFSLQSLTTPSEIQDTTSNGLPTSQLGGQFNSPSSHLDSELHSDKPQIGMQFSNSVFNNKGSPFAASNQDATSQFNLKPISSIPGKFPNQQSQSGQQYFPSYSTKPESQPQFEQGNLSDKQQLNQNSEHKLGTPSVSQTTSNDLNLVSQVGHHSFSSPTKEPVIQANTEAQFNKFNTQTTPFETKENMQFNQDGAIFQQIGTQSNFRPSTYLPPLFQTQSVGFNSQKPIAEFGQSSFSISSLPPTQFGNQQASTIFESESFNNKETTTPQFQEPNQQLGTRFEYKPSTPNLSSLQTQFGGFNTQSTTPQFGQTTTYNSGDLLTSTQFGQSSDSKTTTSQFDKDQQSTTPINEPSTIPPSSLETQTTIKSYDFGEIYDNQKPVQGLISSSKNEDNSQINSQFGAQSSTQFGQQDFSSAQNLRPSQFVQPTIIQLGENTLSTSDQLSTNTPLQSTQLNTQFGQYSSSKTTASQFEIGQQSTTSFNEPSTIPPNILETLKPIQTQKPLQSSEFGEIYNYNKPTQGFISSSQEEDNSQTKPQSQFGAQLITQFAQNDLSSTQKPMSSQFMQPASTVQLGENTISTLGYLSTNTPLQSTQLNTQSGQYSNSKITTSKFEIGQQSTTSFDEPSTIPPNTSETQTPTQSSEFGEIHDYKKPAQGFISTPQNEDDSKIKPHSQFGAQSTSHFGQLALSSAQKVMPSQTTPSSSTFSGSQFSISSFNERDTATTNVDKTESVTPDFISTNPSTEDIQYTSSSQNSDETSKGEIYDYQKPEQGLSSPSDKEGNIEFGQKVPSENSTGIENFEANQQTTSRLAEPTTTLKPFNQETTQKSFETHPQLSFHRACCKGSIFNKEPLNLNNISSSTNSFDQNKGSNSQKETSIEQSSDDKKLEPQKSQFVGIPEQFGGPRKPPSFDATGYHY